MCFTISVYWKRFPLPAHDSERNRTNRVAVSLPVGLSQDLLNDFQLANAIYVYNNNIGSCSNLLKLLISFIHIYVHRSGRIGWAIERMMPRPQKTICHLIPYLVKFVVNCGKKTCYDDYNLSMYALFSLSIRDK